MCVLRAGGGGGRRRILRRIFKGVGMRRKAPPSGAPAETRYGLAGPRVKKTGRPFQLRFSCDLRQPPRPLK